MTMLAVHGIVKHRKRPARQFHRRFLETPDGVKFLGRQIRSLPGRSDVLQRKCSRRPYLDIDTDWVRRHRDDQIPRTVTARDPSPAPLFQLFSPSRTLYRQTKIIGRYLSSQAGFARSTSLGGLYKLQK